jgi:hypothetical protein
MDDAAMSELSKKIVPAREVVPGDQVFHPYDHAMAEIQSAHFDSSSGIYFFKCLSPGTNSLMRSFTVAREANVRVYREL